MTFKQTLKRQTTISAAEHMASITWGFFLGVLLPLQGPLALIAFVTLSGSITPLMRVVRRWAEKPEPDVESDNQEDLP